MYRMNRTYVNIVPDGFYDDDDDLDGFDDFGMPTYERHNTETNNGHDLGEKSEKLSSKNYLMEKLENLLIENELEPLREFLNNNNHIDLDVDLITYSLTPLLYATSRGNPDIINELLLNGANPNESRDQFSPLMSLCSCRQYSEDELFDSAKTLIEFGAAIDVSNKFGNTPLMMACEKNHDQIVELLLPFSKIDAVDAMGWSALFYAVSTGNYEIVKRLLDEGARTDLTDCRGSTPRQIAVDKNFNNIVKLLSNPEDLELDLDDFENEFPHWKDLFPRLKGNKILPFFSDVTQLLYGISLTRYIPNLRSNNIDFHNLLCITDGELETFGIELPYERRRILHTIHSFHGRPWDQKTLYRPPNSNITTFDVLSMVGIINKQIITMNASFKYIKFRLNSTKFTQDTQVGEGDSILNSNETIDCKILLQQLKTISAKITSAKLVIRRLKNLMESIEKKTTPPADYISPNYPCPKYVFLKKCTFYFCTSVLLVIITRRANYIKTVFNRFI